MSPEKGAIMERLKIQDTARPTSPFIAMEMREPVGGGEGVRRAKKGGRRQGR